MVSAIEIFCCYARKDEQLLKDLKTHLAPLQRQGLINTWYDTEISPGSNYEDEINKHLDSAHIILLLVSPDFMDSEYCYSKEMKRAMERHSNREVCVVPIILRPIIFKDAPFGKIQALPKDAKPVTTWPNRDEAFYNVAEDIKKIAEELLDNRASSEPGSALEDTPSTPGQIMPRVDLALEAFWSSFRLFPLKFDRYSFKYWYLYVIGYGILLLIVDLILDNYVNRVKPTVPILPLPGAYPYTRLDVTNGVLLSAIVAVILIMLAFNSWANRIRSIFQTLLDKGRISAANKDVDLNNAYLTFLDEYQKNLLSKKRYWLASLPVGLAVVYILNAIFLKTAFINLNLRFFPAFEKGVWIAKGFIGLILPALLLGYFIAVATWVMYCTGRHIKKLTATFDLAIQITHPDHCGGLKQLGDFCFTMVLPLLIGGFILGIDSRPLDIYSQGFHFPDFRVAANIFLVVLAVPLVIVAFFVPLWNIHQKMKAKKEKYADEFADQSARMHQKLNLAFAAGRPEEAKSIGEQIKLLQIQHPDKVHPSWPFRPYILFFLFGPLFLAILGIIFGLNADGLAVQALKSIFALLFGWK